MSASFGVGWFLLLIGLALAAVGLWRQIAVSTIILVLLLIVTRFAAHSFYVWLRDWLM
jgi:hypothetical protein